MPHQANNIPRALWEIMKRNEYCKDPRGINLRRLRVVKKDRGGLICDDADKMEI
jgi:hypothetical protein